ncbi:hypothetical protein B0T22DRAFT_463515 [Podospora appendiculata]|uniref:FAD-binding domain-containing protein n=1 Tax=Podospora appendiculata TaxID=314037 RepID=A0AAE0XD14_9PEZI|nr:hypothetical protein B0T22DRAFT_463515 [Podospora appendiculata]
MSSESPHVLIIGAGIGGLTLAQSLRKKGISFEIFERDASPTARGAGYCLGLYDLDGLFGDSLPGDLPSLKTACHLLPTPLPSQIVFHLGPKRLAVEDTPETPCLRASRPRLREILLTNLKIQWGKQAERVEERDDGVSVFFVDGSSASGTVLIGADGVFSGIRPHVMKKPNEEILTPFPSATVVGDVQLGIADTEQQLKLGYSAHIAIGAGFALFSGLNKLNIDEDGRVAGGDFYWVISAPDDDVSKPDHWLKTATTQEKLAWAQNKVATLQPPFRVTINTTKPEGVKENAAWWDAAIPELPVVNRVLLIGDAAHPMTPTRGEGGIFAIRDAVLLGKILAESGNSDYASLKVELNEYQQGVCARGYEAIQLSRATMSKGRPPNGLPRSWGHETRPIDASWPFPIDLAEWRAQ